MTQAITADTELRRQGWTHGLPGWLAGHYGLGPSAMAGLLAEQTGIRRPTRHTVLNWIRRANTRTLPVPSHTDTLPDNMFRDEQTGAVGFH